MSVCFTVEFDGYIDNVPYVIQEFDKSLTVYLEFDSFKSMRGLTPLQKLLYLVINEFSHEVDPKDPCDYRIYARIEAEEIADAIDESIYDVRISISELEEMKRISIVKDENGKSLYLAL